MDTTTTPNPRPSPRPERPAEVESYRAYVRTPHGAYPTPAKPIEAALIHDGGTRHSGARSDARLLAEDAAELTRHSPTYEEAIAKALASIALSLAFKS